MFRCDGKFGGVRGSEHSPSVVQLKPPVFYETQLLQGNKRPKQRREEVKRAGAVFSSKKLPPPTPNFQSHLHHIKTLNIANDSCMEY